MQRAIVGQYTRIYWQQSVAQLRQRVYHIEEKFWKFFEQSFLFFVCVPTCDWFPSPKVFSCPRRSQGVPVPKAFPGRSRFCPSGGHGSETDG
jgi:hypothetical protein